MTASEPLDLELPNEVTRLSKPEPLTFRCRFGRHKWRLLAILPDPEPFWRCSRCQKRAEMKPGWP